MSKAQELLCFIAEANLDPLFPELLKLNKDISTKDRAIKALADFIKKNNATRLYKDILYWLKQLTDKQYLKLYKQYA